MKTIQPTFLLLIFCLLGCTSTRTLRPGHEAGYAALNKHALGKQANVTFVDGHKIKVENLRMTADSTYWDGANKIATDQIREVRWRSAFGRTKQLNLVEEGDKGDLYEKISKSTRGRGAMLILKDGQELQVRQLSMTPDFTYWIDPQIGQRDSAAYAAIATSQIKEVRFIDRGKGARKAASIGSLMGVFLGFAVGEDCPDRDSGFGSICVPREELAVVGAISGALWGGIVGAIIGHRDVYQIKHEAATGTN